jgi:cation transport regulator
LKKEEVKMPYKSTTDLPQAIRNYLPIQAQMLFCEAFNHAWRKFETPESEMEFGTQEELAHRIAWAAVKKRYVRKGDRWQSKL